MKISVTPLSLRQSLQTLGVVALLTGLSACGGNSSPTADPASATQPNASAPSHSASAAKSEAPVPVESNPLGDIPDNLAFVSYTNKPGGYSFTHPEGWARTGTGTQVLFTDKLNGVAVGSLAANKAPTVSSANSTDIARLRSSVPAFELQDITAVTLPGGEGVRIIYRRNSDPDPVTGKVYRDEVEEYLIYHAGRLVRMDLFGPVGADNVDAYQTMSQSLTIK